MIDPAMILAEADADLTEEFDLLVAALDRLKFPVSGHEPGKGGWFPGETPRIGAMRFPNPALLRALDVRDAADLQDLARIVDRLPAYLRDVPDDPAALALMGHACYKQIRIAEALPCLRRALELGDLRVLPELAIIADLCDLEALTHRLGRLSLEQTERMSLATFAQLPPAARGALSDGGRGFDPDDPSRNIIAFSLWGDLPKYVTGAVVNAQIAPHVFPGWTARFYHDATVPDDALVALRHYGAQTIPVEEASLAEMGMFWRFLVANDPAVNVFLVRDTDCRLNGQELNAVHDWLRSGKRFHVMRDHPYHIAPMMGGMWGGTAGVLPDIRNLLHSGPTYDGRYNQDQIFLWERIWPLIVDDACSHDSFHDFRGARRFPDGFMLDKIRGQHVGGGYTTTADWRSLYSGAGIVTPAAARLEEPDVA